MILLCLILVGAFHLELINSEEGIEISLKPSKNCQPKSKSVEKCRSINLNPERIICTGNLSNLSEVKKAKIVYLCDWDENFLNPEKILKRFPEVEKLTIENGNVSEFLTDFPRSVHLRHLALINLNIEEIRSKLLASLENLTTLDLSENRLRRIPVEIIKNQPSLSRIILFGNPWDCSSDIIWILDKAINSKISNKNGLTCGEGLYSGKPLYSVMRLLKKMKKDCPEKICTCLMENIVWNAEEKSRLIPVITVNCSGKGITEFPSKLPANTTTLLLTGNKISNVFPLIQNKIYETIADIYLDYNHVRSIDVLEGSLWLNNFRVFSLRGNNLTQLPVYALDNAFEKNTKLAKIYLGENPWKCDCSFTPDFQNLLIKYRTLVKDKNDVTCSEKGEDENSNLMIIKLSTNFLCRKDNAINPLDVLSAVFAILVLLILGKLLFDWWTFKRTGNLPWIAAQLPC